MGPNPLNQLPGLQVVGTDVWVEIPGPAATGLDEILGLAMSTGVYDAGGHHWTMRAELHHTGKYGGLVVLRDGEDYADGIWETSRVKDFVSVSCRIPGGGHRGHTDAPFPGNVAIWIENVHLNWALARANAWRYE